MTLDDLAAHAEMHPELLARFVEFGLIQPTAASGTLFRRLRSIKRLRHDLGINLQAVAIVLDLLERLRALEHENASLRAQL
jgi:hypothetical protein